MQPLLGTPVLESIQQEMKAEAEKLIASGKRTPHLAIILLGNNGASETYVKKKLEQFATPNQIYDAPESLFVNQFVGTSNTDPPEYNFTDASAWHATSCNEAATRVARGANSSQFGRLSCRIRLSTWY